MEKTRKGGEGERSPTTCEDGCRGEPERQRAKFGRGLSGVKEDLVELASSLNRLFVCRTKAPENKPSPRDCDRRTSPCTSGTNAAQIDSDCESDINRLIESLETSLKESEQNPASASHERNNSVKKDLLELYSEISRGILSFREALAPVPESESQTTLYTKKKKSNERQQRPSFTFKLANLHCQALDSTRKVMMWLEEEKLAIKMNQPLEWLDFKTPPQQRGDKDDLEISGRFGEKKNQQSEQEHEQEHFSCAGASDQTATTFDQLSIGQSYCSKFSVVSAHSRSHSSSFVVLENDLVF